MGNRFEHLQAAVDTIFEEVGHIVRISSIYETPALGFEGNDFLNCVLWVRTSLTSKKMMSTLLEIEKRIGRERNSEEGYVSRPIDIDIISYEDEIKDTKNLKLPHPRIQERKFVLHPLAEINSQWEHPVLNTNVIKLLAITEDESVLSKQSKWLRNPKKDFSISQFNYLAIEGNIGAGKTSLASMIAEDFNAKLILERFKDNAFLPKFYKDQSRYAFPLEMSFLADRYQQLLEDIKQFDLFKDAVVADYDAYKSLIFAKVTLAEEEYALYKKLFHLMHKELPKPDLYIYLYQNTDRLLENIRKRGRSYEKDIPAKYLQEINDGYFEFIKGLPQDRVRVIDISELDFIKNRKDYLFILRQIVS